MSTKNIHREVDELQPRRDSALLWANEMRIERGMEPLDDLPKGDRTDTDYCPLARATGLPVGSEAIYDRRTDEFSPIPDDVMLFLSDFDSGLHPDLIEEDS